ncbi:MAG: hypothetical protein V4603_11205 [Pseudomonadota bacterium]
MRADELRKQAGFCRSRTLEIRGAAAAINDPRCLMALLGLAEAYESRAMTLEGRLGPARIAGMLPR